MIHSNTSIIITTVPTKTPPPATDATNETQDTTHVATVSGFDK